MLSNRRWITGALLAASSLLGFAPSSGAQTMAEINAILDRKVQEFNVPAPGRPALEVFDGLASTYELPIIVDPSVTGDVAFRVYGTHLRGLLNAICEPKGWHYEIRGEDGAAYLNIRRFITRSYSIDYPHVDQQATSSASVSLSGGDTSNGSMNGQNPVQVLGASSTTDQNQRQSGSGSSSVSLTASSKSNFWELLEAGARRYVSPEEILDVNPFAGSITLTGSLATHALVEDYVTRTMRRVRRHASITVHAIRVDLTDAHATGVDLMALKSEIGDLAHIGGDFKSATIGGNSYTASGVGTRTGAGAANFGTIGSVQLGGPTTQIVFGAGKLSALITALSKRGQVMVADTSNASALNNQMALIQVTEDMPFASRTNTTTYNPGGGNTNGTTPIAATNYGWQTVSFGNVLEVTPQISDALVSTIVVAPSVTEFRGEVKLEDGSGSRPRTATRRYRSTYVLRNHETAVIGAFMEVTKGTNSDGTPVLERIPILGGLFRTDRSVKAKTEFILLMTVDAEDGDVAPPTTVETPSADRARRLGASKELLDAIRTATPGDGAAPTAAAVQPVRAATPEVVPVRKVELVGQGGL